jgi:hypothetical protein
MMMNPLIATNYVMNLSMLIDYLLKPYYIARAYWKYLFMPKYEGAEIRMEICKVCDFYKGGICTACGCILKVKTNDETQKCPEDLWPE